MRWYYKVSMLLWGLSWTVFLVLAVYHTDTKLYYPEGDLEGTPTGGYSWIWYHIEHWSVSLLISLAALMISVYGLILDIRDSRWEFSLHTKWINNINWYDTGYGNVEIYPKTEYLDQTVEWNEHAHAF
jgi:hypothetical protein